MTQRVLPVLFFMCSVGSCTAPPGSPPAPLSATAAAPSVVGTTTLTETVTLRDHATAVVTAAILGTSEPTPRGTPTLPGPAATTMPTPTFPKAALLDIKEVRPVRFTKPIMFWRNGEQMEATQAILLHVNIGQPFLFLPRDASLPLFLYGDGVCNVIKSPMEPSGAALLAPMPGPGEPQLLWLTPAGVLPQELGREQTQAWRKQVVSQNPGNWLAVPTMVTDEPKLYVDLQQLSDELKQQ